MTEMYPGGEGSFSPESWSQRGLMAEVGRHFVSKFAAFGLVPADLAQLGPEVEAGRQLSFQDFQADIPTFIEQNLQFGQSLLPEVKTALYRDFPISTELLAQIHPTDFVSPAVEKKIRRWSVASWIELDHHNREVEQRLWGAESAINDFTRAVIESMPEGGWDDGYDLIDPNAGIDKPSEVIQRPAFMDIYAAPPHGIRVGSGRYLGFYVPVRETAFLEDYGDEWEENADPESQNNLQLSVFEQSLATIDDEKTEPLTNVQDPGNFLLITDSSISSVYMEWLFSEPEYEALVEFLYAHYLDQRQTELLADLEEFFGELAARKEQQALIQLEELSSQVRHSFWQRVETYLESHQSYRVIWFNKQVGPAPSSRQLLEEESGSSLGEIGEQTVSPFKFPTNADPTILFFRKGSNGSILVDMSVGYLGGSVGTAAVSKHLTESPQKDGEYWIFEDTDLEVGEVPNDELEDLDLSDADLTLNNFVSRLRFAPPVDGADYEATLSEARHLTAQLQHTLNLPTFIGLWSQSGVINDDGTVNTLVGEYLRPKPFTRLGQVWRKPAGVDPTQN